MIQKHYPKRSLSELIDLAKPLSKWPEFIAIARRSTPTKAKSECIRQGGSDNVAKTCRWAAVLKRDFGSDEFNRLFNGTARPSTK